MTYYLPKTDSTNNRLLEYITDRQSRGEQIYNLTTFYTDFQTAGRGQQGNSWESEAGENLLFSTCLLTGLPVDQQFCVSQIVSIAIAKVVRRVFEQYAPEHVDAVNIKWPNDIMFDGRKLVGILTEITGELGKITYIVVGIGINVNINRDDFPEEIRDVATSLSEMNGGEIPRVKFFRAVLEEFDKLYRQVNAAGFDIIFERWKKYNITLGKNVRVISAGDGGETFTGKAVDLDSEGALIVETEKGLRTVYAGDVSIR